MDAVKFAADRDTGQSRGFGFVGREGPAAASAMEALDGKGLGGRTLRNNEARERERAPRQARNRY